MLFLLDGLHPFFGCGFQLLKAKAWTQSIWYPSDYIGRQQSEHGDLIAIALEDNIRCEIGLSRSLVDDIGGQHGHLGLGIHAVEHLATRLNVVVAYAGGIVWEVIQHFGDQVRMLCVLVGAILERRTLHVVAVVQQDKPVAKLGFHFLEGIGIVGKLIVTAVSISGFDDGQSGFFCGTRS